VLADFVKVITPSAAAANAPLKWLRQLSESQVLAFSGPADCADVNTAANAADRCSRAEPARICPNAYRCGHDGVLAELRLLRIVLREIPCVCREKQNKHACHHLAAVFSDLAGSPALVLCILFISLVSYCVSWSGVMLCNSPPRLHLLVLLLIYLLLLLLLLLLQGLRHR
jgi:uncharacterized protein YciI